MTTTMMRIIGAGRWVVYNTAALYRRRSLSRRVSSLCLVTPAANTQSGIVSRATSPTTIITQLFIDQTTTRTPSDGPWRRPVRGNSTRFNLHVLVGDVEAACLQRLARRRVKHITNEWSCAFKRWWNLHNFSKMNERNRYRITYTAS